MNPGNSVASPRSIVSAPGGMDAAVPIPRILPSAATTNPGEISLPALLSKSRAARNTTGRDCDERQMANPNKRAHRRMDATLASMLPTGSEIALRAENLSKVYRSGEADLVIFAHLDLQVRRGEMLALVGESGAGKSTLLHLLGGLDRPTTGTIYYESIDISRLADSELASFRNREIGFVWQIHYLLPEFTALENVMMPLLIRGVSHAKAASDSLSGLDEVGLGARATHRAGELSGGEQQRVVLARAPGGKAFGSSWPMSQPATWISGPAKWSSSFWNVCIVYTRSPRSSLRTICRSPREMRSYPVNGRRDPRAWSQ